MKGYRKLRKGKDIIKNGDGFKMPNGTFRAPKPNKCIGEKAALEYWYRPIKSKMKG